MGGAADCGTWQPNRVTPMVNPSEHRYLDAQRQLHDATDRLRELDEQAAAPGEPIDRRTALTRGADPAAAAAELLEQDWPDRVELFDVVTAWLQAFEESTQIWAELPPATQMRLSQPPEQ